MERVDSFPLIEPGELRHSITIEQITPTQGQSGGFVNAWSTWAAGVRAKIEPLGGSEMLGGASFHPEATHRVTMRYRAGLTADMRISYNGRYFDILNINNVLERNRFYVITAREGRSHGNV
jgi:SPP1 family predicted phage head-tail adaptor